MLCMSYRYTLSLVDMACETYDVPVLEWRDSMKDLLDSSLPVSIMSATFRMQYI